ncbi:hypothetical protein NRP93_003215 [Clostridium botulinum]|nr:hypothetical protein [Clostridium botulinum]
MNIRLEKAKERLNYYYEAELAVLSNQEYRIGTRTMRRADLAEIRRAITDLEKQIKQLEALESRKGTRRVFRGVPRDL